MNSTTMWVTDHVASLVPNMMPAVTAAASSCFASNWCGALTGCSFGGNTYKSLGNYYSCIKCISSSGALTYYNCQVVNCCGACC